MKTTRPATAHAFPMAVFAMASAMLCGTVTVLLLRSNTPWPGVIAAAAACYLLICTGAVVLAKKKLV